MGFNEDSADESNKPEKVEKGKAIYILDAAICILFFLIIGVIAGTLFMKHNIDKEKQLNRIEMEQTLAKIEAEKKAKQETEPAFITESFLDKNNEVYNISEYVIGNGTVDYSGGGITILYDNRSRLYIEAEKTDVKLDEKLEEKTKYYNDLGANGVDISEIHKSDNYSYFVIIEDKLSNVSTVIGELKSSKDKNYRLEFRMVADHIDKLTIEEAIGSLLETL